MASAQPDQILFRSRAIEIVEDGDIPALGKQAICQIAANESGSSGNQELIGCQSGCAPDEIREEEAEVTSRLHLWSVSVRGPAEVCSR